MTGGAKRHVPQVTRAGRAPTSRAMMPQAATTHAALAVALGGAGGAAARYLTARGLTLAGGWDGAWSTAIVNVAGAFALGVAAQLLADRPGLTLLLMTGFLGAFTTFSTFAMDAAWLLRERGVLLAAVYVGASVALALAAFACGALLAGGRP